jgi:protoporphyrinogen oxidase
MSDGDFIAFAADELARTGMIDRDDVEDGVRIKVKKAYPSYHGSYRNLPAVIAFLDSIPNLYCIGRNGQHRYNNMDHSMLTAMEAVRNITEGRTAKDNIWSVNTEKDYHEKKNN